MMRVQVVLQNLLFFDVMRVEVVLPVRRRITSSLYTILRDQRRLNITLQLMSRSFQSEILPVQFETCVIMF